MGSQPMDTTHPHINVSGMVQTHSQIVAIIQKWIDMIAILVAGMCSNLIIFNKFVIEQHYLILTLFWCVLSYFCFGVSSAYTTWRGKSLVKEIQAVLNPWIFTSILMLVFVSFFEFKTPFSRNWMLTYFCTAFFLLGWVRIGVRAVLKRLRSKGFNQRTVCIVGRGEMVSRVKRRLEHEVDSGLRVIGVFGDDVPGDTELTGGLDDYLTWISRRHVDQLWLALPLESSSVIEKILFDIRHFTLDIRLIPDIFAFNLLNHSLTTIAGLPVVNLNSSPMEGKNAVFKRILDIIVSLMILCFFGPMMIGIAFAVKITSKGPIIFKQKRHGFNGKIVEIWKFRSMFVHKENCGSVTQAKKNDSRITPLGGFLRKTSLDEFPQFFNVLQGRMSIVGPRPHALAHNEEYKEQVEAYMQRHRVKPGVTGWAQVNGFRGETDSLDKMEKRVEYDLHYINNWSVLFDLKIIFLTVFKGFVNPNAY